MTPTPSPPVHVGPDGRALTLGRVHLVGVGGAGMSGIAKVLLARGCRVSGSDARGSGSVPALRALGATVHVGHAAEQVPDDVDVVVRSTAIRDDNPELVAARERDVPVLARAAALGALLRDRRGVVVSGTHGKTTTTSMLVVGLQAAGGDPGFVVGADLNEAGSNAHAGTDEVLVAEADESDGSFLLLPSEVAVVTNVEVDHVDHYGGGLDEVLDAFRAFLDRVADGGAVVLGADDAGARALADHARARGLEVVLAGRADDADVRLADETHGLDGGRARVVVDGRSCLLHVPAPGAHQLSDAACALAAVHLLGADVAVAAEGLGDFTGVRRRFEHRGSAAGRRVVDDYAHHPTEVAATLAAARQVAGRGRVVAVLQPHRWSRTAAMHGELGRALGAADEVVVTEVYGAGEDPVPGAGGRQVAAAVPLPPAQVVFEASMPAVVEQVVSRSRPDDVVVLLGAGDVTVLAPAVLDALAAAEAER